MIYLYNPEVTKEDIKSIANDLTCVLIHQVTGETQ